MRTNKVRRYLLVDCQSPGLKSSGVNQDPRKSLGNPDHQFEDFIRTKIGEMSKILSGQSTRVGFFLFFIRNSHQGRTCLGLGFWRPVSKFGCPAGLPYKQCVNEMFIDIAVALAAR